MTIPAWESPRSKETDAREAPTAPRLPPPVNHVLEIIDVFHTGDTEPQAIAESVDRPRYPSNETMQLPGSAFGEP
jgi:hypothetical protein